MRKQQGYKLTERDVEILNFINMFGFCEIRHVSEMFNLKRPRNYQLINKLMRAGLINHRRVFYGKQGIYNLTAKGAKLTQLPPKIKIPLAEYDHNLRIVEAYIKLRRLYPVGQWISERQLEREKFFDGKLGKTGHLPDAYLILPNGNKVAIEIELAQKDRRRLEKILKGYITNFDIKEVWYFCSKQSADNVRAAAADLKMPFVKVFDLKKLLDDEVLGSD